MKPFNLETVLTYRQRLKDQATNRFQQAQNQRNSAHDQFIEKRDEYMSLIETSAKLQHQGIAVGEHIRYQNRIEFVSAELEKLEDTLKKKNQTVIRERKHLIKKNKELQVLEKLKEKQNSEYLQFINKKESAMLDEIAILHRSQQESAESREFI